jgi:uncharacterized membrane protein YkvA (DUF1232 family)
MSRLIKEMLILGLAFVAGAYLMFPSLLPDFIPVIGWMDEGVATLILINTLRYYGVDLTNFYGKNTRVIRRRRIPSSHAYISPHQDSLPVDDDQHSG